MLGENLNMSDSEVGESIFTDYDFSDSDSPNNNQGGNEEGLESDSSRSSVEDIDKAHPWFRVMGEELDRDDPYEFLETVGPVNMPQGISTPVDYFMLFFTLNLVQMFVRETNKYAANFLTNTQLKRRSLGHKWVAVTVTEMKAFISMILNMGLIRKPTIKSYWSTSSSQKTPFPQVMSRDRFELILKFFHMVDSTHLPRPGEDGYDPCAWFDPLVEHANQVSRHYYKPHREICIDESLICTKSKT